MKNLISKELRLSVPGFCYVFLVFSFLVFCPGYPILFSAFFICMGFYQGFQLMRENNDILYTVLLPVKKTDAVSAKYFAAVVYEMIGFAAITVCTLVRMFVVYDNSVYLENALMSANPAFLGFVLLLYMFFNIVFIGGYYRTIYKIGGPFLRFALLTLLLVAVCEMLRTVPGFEYFGDISGDMMWAQGLFLAACAACYVLFTFLSCRVSQKRFEKMDL